MIMSQLGRKERAVLPSRSGCSSPPLKFEVKCGAPGEIVPCWFFVGICESGTCFIRLRRRGKVKRKNLMEEVGETKKWKI